MQKLKWYLQLARTPHYVKNGFIWLPLFFGYKLNHAPSVLKTLYTCIAFCMVCSAIYVINDLKDVSEDRLHPTKKYRPLASNRITASEAVGFSIALLTLSCLFSLLLLPKTILFILGVYAILNIAYSVYLKNHAIIDITCIAIGFVLRVYAGGISAQVTVSQWIIIMTFLLAIFLALAKRRDDLIILSEGGERPRASISGYNKEFVSISMMVMASVIIVSYILYTVSPEVTVKHGTHKLYLTGFWVILGLLRYLQITFVENQSGSPTQVLIRDRFLQITILFWLINAYVLLYYFHHP